MNIYQRCKAYVRYKLIPPYNMFTDKAEQYYFRQYYQHIQKYFSEGKSLLDIGCQYGRFTIPVVEARMHVVSTDIRSGFFKFIKKKTAHLHFQPEFRNETVKQTIENLRDRKFDVILCLELLYNLKESEMIFNSLSQMLKKGGIIITSHRTTGYYIQRFIHEKRWSEISDILNKNHSNYNTQTKYELCQMYENAGLEVVEIFPVGMFSGFGKDGGAGIANVKKFSAEDLNNLFQYEMNVDLIKNYSEYARYTCIIGKK